jgi:hypothetical protein
VSNRSRNKPFCLSADPTAVVMPTAVDRPSRSITECFRTFEVNFAASRVPVRTRPFLAGRIANGEKSLSLICCRLLHRSPAFPLSGSS